jgi:transcription elongation factor Elf1
MSKKKATKKKAGPAGSLAKAQIKPEIICPSCKVEGSNYKRVRKDDKGHNRVCGECGHRFTAPKTKRREDPRGVVSPTEPTFRPSNDPEQTKLLVKVQVMLREKGSRNSVVPNLCVLTEVARLRKVEAEYLAQAGYIRAAIDMVEGTKLYKALDKAKKAEPLAAKDAFKFT